MTDPERIILEPAGDGERYRIRTEGGDTEGADTEGHLLKSGRFEVAPDGEDADGNPLFRLTGGDDAEGHRFSSSDLRLKRDVRAL
jgi:hypothetical protein